MTHFGGMRCRPLHNIGVINLYHVHIAYNAFQQSVHNLVFTNLSFTMHSLLLGLPVGIGFVIILFSLLCIYIAFDVF